MHWNSRKFPGWFSECSFLWTPSRIFGNSDDEKRRITPGVILERVLRETAAESCVITPSLGISDAWRIYSFCRGIPWEISEWTFRVYIRRSYMSNFWINDLGNFWRNRKNSEGNFPINFFWILVDFFPGIIPGKILEVFLVKCMITFLSNFVKWFLKKFLDFF